MLKKRKQHKAICKAVKMAARYPAGSKWREMWIAVALAAADCVMEKE